VTAESLPTLLTEIRACRVCADALPLGPRPVVQAGAGARLRIIGQAPGRKVRDSGVPWDDASGQRLRDWLGLTPEQFYDPDKVAILPIGFCYPGKAASGDRPPRPECAPLWHDRINAGLGAVQLTLLVGHYAQARYLGARRKANLTETVRAWRDYAAAGIFPLPHPSPRNQPWFTQHSWFAADLLPALHAAVGALDL
jgi:uracil-DNA glycosylase